MINKTILSWWYLSDISTITDLRDLKESLLDIPKKRLCPEIWTEDLKLKPEIKEYLKKRIDYIIEKLNFEKEDIMSICIFGSITTYHYNEYTDVDVHFIVKLENEKEETLLNRKLQEEIIKDGYEYPIINGEEFTHPFNFYIERYTTSKYPVTVDGIYDILQDQWIQEPHKKVFKVDPVIYDISIQWARKIDNSISELKRDIIEYLTILYDLKYSEKKKIEFAFDNITFKKMFYQKKKEIIYDAFDINYTMSFLKNFRNESQKKLTELFEKNENIPNEIKINYESIDIYLGIIIWKSLQRWGYFKITSKIRKYVKKYIENIIDEKELINNIIDIVIERNWRKIISED